MNYQKIHNQLIERGKIRNLTDRKKTYFETHHIIPKCMNGSDDDSNLVNLTAREHFLIHWLLHRIYPDNTYLQNAFFRCAYKGNSKNRNFIPSSRSYEEARMCRKLSIKTRKKMSKTRKENYKNGKCVAWNKGTIGLVVAWNKGIKTGKNKKQSKTLKEKYASEEIVVWNKGKKDCFSKKTLEALSRNSIFRRFSKEIFEKRSLTRKINYKLGLWVHHQKGKPSKKRIPIIQFDLFGNKIAEFVSINEAAKKSNISIASVRKSYSKSIPVCNFIFKDKRQ